MPDYSLTCQACGEAFSVFGSFEKRQKATCPKCGSQKLEQAYRTEKSVGVRQIKHASECPAAPGAGCQGCMHRH